MTPLQAFVSLSSGQCLRVQALGQGPVLVMCHESPRSSSALIPLASRVMDRFTCLMIDTPGFGLSDPLALTRAEIPDFARVVIDLVTALDLGPVPIYGTHTGAAIAIEAVREAPDRVTTAILDGYAIFTEVERDQLLASYLTPIVPGLDGALPAWLWSRVRDQFTAFPWNQVGDGSALGFGPPSLAAMQRVVDDFLQAGDAYRTGYAAAFRYDHFAPLPEVQRPVHIVTREDDLLFAHMERARGAGAHVHLQALSPDRAAWGAAIADRAARHAGDAATDAATLIAQVNAQARDRHIVNTALGPVLAESRGRGTPVVLLHDVPGDIAQVRPVAERLMRTHRAVSLSLPGFSSAGHPIPEPWDRPALARAVDDALAALGLADAPVVSFGASLPVALALGGQRRIIVVDPWPQAAPDLGQDVPDLSARWDGAHLMAAFWWARDAELYKPWTNRVNADMRRIGNERDVTAIHNRFRAIVLAGQPGADLAATLYASNASDALAAARDRAEVILYGTDPDAAALTGWATPLVGAARVHTTPRAPEACARLLAERLA